MSLSRALCSRCASSVSPAAAATAAPRLGSVAHFATNAQGNNVQQQQTPRPRKGNKPFKRHEKGKPVHGNKSIDLFNSVITEGQQTRGSDVSSRAKLLNADELMQGLQEIKESKDGIQARCDRFSSEFWPSIRAAGFPLPKQLYSALRACLVQLCRDLAAEPLGPSGRRVYTRLSTTMVASAIHEVGLHAGLVLEMCLVLARDTSMTPMERGDFLSDILNMWMAISSMKRPRSVTRQPGFILPDTEQFTARTEQLKAQREKESGGPELAYTSAALTAIFPHFDPTQSIRVVPGLLATLAVFSLHQTPALVAKAAPLLRVLHLALKDAPVDEAYLRSVMNLMNSKPWPNHPRRADEAQDLVLSHWGSVQAWIDNPSAWVAARPQPRQPTLSSIHGELRKAYAAGDWQGVTRIWENLNRSVAKSPKLEAELRHDPAHLDFWFYIWCALGRENMLPETEALMESMQHQPTIKTYTAMMHGWKMSKKPDSISMLWERLHSSGMRLDQHVWTERISALIELGKPQEGVAALGQMMNAWKADPKKEVEPTIEVINAAFDGLIRRDRKAAFEILEWAGQAGIKPDVLTFNILLRESAKTESEVPMLLRKMKQAGIEPNEGTFTIIMDEMLGSMAGSDESDLVSGISAIFAIIDDSGLRLNQEMYAKMLHVIVSRLEASDRAVEVVLRNMADRGHDRISPHMLLILLQRLLRDENTNAGAIDALLSRYGFTSIATGDQRLWEHVIRSYAAVGDAGNALRVYDELASAGRPATTPYCLVELLRTLLSDARTEDAARVVDRAFRDTAQRDSARSWRHHFWHLAHQNGLLRGKTLPVDLEKALRQANSGLDG